MGKPKLAVYWAGSCGGCDVATLDIEAHLLDVAAAFDIVLWPAVTDFKYRHVEAMADGVIDLCLFNGAIRTAENEHLARLLRRTSRTLVAFGSCAMEGCVIGLANQFTREALLARVFTEAPSLDGSRGTVPQPVTTVPEGELHLPEFLPRLRTLDQTVAVDYYIPGCPPQPAQIWAVLEHVIAGQPLPARGAVLGAGEKTCCEECARTRDAKKLRRFVRPHEIVPDPTRCLLDQGLVCLGPATRSGCGALCPAVGMPCRGCYGPPPGSRDQGAKMLSALASVIDSQDPDEIDRIIGTLDDPVGTLYRFSLAAAPTRGMTG